MIYLPIYLAYIPLKKGSQVKVFRFGDIILPSSVPYLFLEEYTEERLHVAV